MKTAMNAETAISAWKLSQSGSTLEQIKALLGLRCSRVTIWRAIRSVTTTTERIEAALAGANWDALSVGELLIVLTPPPVKGGDDVTPEPIA